MNVYSPVAKMLNTMLSIPVTEWLLSLFLFLFTFYSDFIHRSLEWVFAIRLFAAVNSLLFICECERVLTVLIQVFRFTKSFAKLSNTLLFTYPHKKNAGNYIGAPGWQCKSHLSNERLHADQISLSGSLKSSSCQVGLSHLVETMSSSLQQTFDVIF